MAETDPFAVLALAPTLELAQVKRAYFAQLQLHPPHSDPAGFQRLRQAYEALLSPGGLAQAFLAAPLDVPAELARWRERWQPALDRDRARVSSQTAAAEAVGRFVELAAGSSLAQASKRLG